MFKKIVLCLFILGLSLGIGFNQGHVYAAESNGLADLLGGLFKSPVNPTAYYTAEDFKNKVTDTIKSNPAKFDAKFKGQGFLIKGIVQEIGSQVTNQKTYYIVQFKGDLVCLFEANKAKELANLSANEEAAIVGKATITKQKEGGTLVMLYDCRIANDKDKEPYKKQLTQTLTPPPPQQPEVE